MKELTTALALLGTALTVIAAGPGFVAVPVEKSRVSFGHSFDEDHAKGNLNCSGFACGGVCVVDVDVVAGQNNACVLMFENRGK